MDPLHRRIAVIALGAAGEEHGLALAGGYAVRAHGMGERPSGDVDLFMDWHRRGDFPAAVELVIDSLTREGFQVIVDARAATFAAAGRGSRCRIRPGDVRASAVGGRSDQ